MFRLVPSQSSARSSRIIHYVRLEDFLLSNRSLVEHAQRKLLYNELASFFDLATSRNSEREAAFIGEIIQTFFPKAKSILDVGCGIGRHAEILFKKHGYSVWGVDLSEEMIKLARRRCPNCKFKKMDMRNIELNETFDVVMCMWTTFNYLSNLGDIERFFKGVHKALKNNGLLIIDMKNHQKELRSSYSREAKNDSYLIKLLVRKRVVNNVSESIYLYLIKSLETGEESFALDQELNKVYTREEVIDMAKPLFHLIRCYGDYDCSSELISDKSDRVIFAFRKI